MKKVFLTLLLLVSFPLIASHIVGGEFELIHISGNTYRLNLIIYFDQINGAAGAKDPNARVFIYRKRDNTLMASPTLPLSNESNVPYTQPDCSNGEIITTKLLYTADIVLSPEFYDDPEGYFVVWERCCRNYSITNIYSQVPTGANISAGQTFYLEFPPVVKRGQPFINSSPRLFPPLNDFACPFRPYYVDFAGQDDDGDSLVYSLVTPLNTTASVALPTPSPGPYPPITWRPGYSLNNIINGKPDLRISKDGLLTATPRTQGLFVFAVKIDEYRNGEKIGESRRDFQMLVVDACPQAEPPKITGKKSTDISFTYSENMTVSFDGNLSDADRCIQVRISDPDANKIEDQFTEKISLRVVSLNFKKNVNEILPAIKSTTLTNGSTQDFTICFPRCPFIEGGPYQIGIIAQDDACSLPLSDTLRVTVNTIPPANKAPYFVNPVQPLTSVTIYEGGFYESTFEIRDDDNQELIPFVTTDGFQLKDAGMSVTFDEPRVNGIITGKIRWDAFCNIYDFTKRNEYEVKIQVNDRDVCDNNQLVFTTYKFRVLLPGNADPIIDTDLTSNPQERTVLNLERRVNETLSFNVIGNDLTDNDFLSLDVTQREFFNELGISFPATNGNGKVTSLFKWDITCKGLDLKKKDTYDFRFLVVDNSNKCRFYKADTVDVRVKILPPLNEAPKLTIIKDNAPITSEMEVILGEPISFKVIGTDADNSPTQDLISLELTEASGNISPEGYSFSNVTGKGYIESDFYWLPDCSVFQQSIYENSYTFKFRITDDRCFAGQEDAGTVNIRLKDESSDDSDFLPPNVFTPNGDGCNDYFALEGIEQCPFSPDQVSNPDDRVSLPPDNCVRKFEAVRIYNRWGKEVFMSNQRNFRWYGIDMAAGVYYYVVQYSDKEYKGSVSIRF